MIRSIQFEMLSEAQRAGVIVDFHRDTGQKRAITESIVAFESILNSIPYWNAETAEPIPPTIKDPKC